VRGRKGARKTKPEPRKGYQHQGQKHQSWEEAMGMAGCKPGRFKKENTCITYPPAGAGRVEREGGTGGKTKKKRPMKVHKKDG